MRSRHLAARFRQGLWAGILLLLIACDLNSAPAASPTAAQEPTIPAPTAALELPADVLLQQGLAKRLIGDYDAAAEDFHTITTQHPGAPEARPASYYLAESFALRERWTSAAEAFTSFLQDKTQDEWSARALFWLARTHEQAGNWEQAAATYAQYRALQTPLAPYAQLREAAQLAAGGRQAEAAAAYQAAAESDIVAGERSGAYEKAIALLLADNQPKQALQLYPPLLALADQPDNRARLLEAAAQLADQQGDTEQARAWRAEILAKAPSSAQAIIALAELQADPQTSIDPALAASIYDTHGLALEAIEQYTTAISATTILSDALELRRKQALAQRSLGDFSTASATLAQIGAESPNSETGRQAQLDWVQTQGQAGDTAGAIEGYRQFAQAYPDDPRAPEALSRAAILLERLGDTTGAAQQRLELGRRYPNSELAAESLDSAGRFFYQADDRDTAQEAWELLGNTSETLWAARGNYWAARAAQENDHPEDAKRLYEAARQSAPNSYYAIRADEEQGVSATPALLLGSTPDTAAWHAAEDWIAEWTGAPAYYLDEQGYPATISSSREISRAIELGDLNLSAEARLEWDAAQTQVEHEPLQLYLLARRAQEAGATDAAMRATAALAAQAPSNGVDLPVAIGTLLFPTPYADQIIEQAKIFDIDPRAVLAMMRQESQFAPNARSWVGALGLTQVMPSTGEAIASNLQVSDFTSEQLLRPMISIRFGTYYLAQQTAAMQGSLPAGLAAYNGGPGNAQRWAGGNQVADPDSFVEAIDYPETNAYVKLVYGYYGAYQRLYAIPEPMAVRR